MIDKKVAVVTGGNRGIGLGIAVKLAQDGCALAIMARSSKEKVEENLEKIKKEQAPLLYYSGDLAESDDRVNFCNKIMEKYGRIDFLVNNAGVPPRERKDMLDMTEESFDFVMNINLKGTFFLTQEVAKIMVKEVQNKDNCGADNSSSGKFTPEIKPDLKPKIINIASISSYTSSPERGQYCISKAGISMMTKLYADRLAEYGINVYEIRPGIIYTDMTEVVKDKYDKLIAEGLTPIKRWGYPEDVARAVSVLCEGKLDFSTGEVINVDGGFHLQRL